MVTLTGSITLDSQGLKVTLWLTVAPVWDLPSRSMLVSVARTRRVEDGARSVIKDAQSGTETDSPGLALRHNSPSGAM